MAHPVLLGGAAAALLSAAPIPPAAEPSQAELEAALRGHYVTLAAHPSACRKGMGCLKPPKAIKVRDYDCQARGTDSRGSEILYCRVTYTQKGGSFDGVKSPDECVPLRANQVTAMDTGGSALVWEYAFVDYERKCPGARH